MSESPHSICPRCSRPRFSHSERCPYNENLPVTATEEERNRRRDAAQAIFDAWAKPLGEIDIERTGAGIYIRKKYVSTEGYPASHRLGRMTFRLRGAEAEILGMDNLEQKTKGTGTTLLAVLLAEHPEIDRIRSFLHEDNSEAYCKARKDGKSHLDALEATPAMSIRHKFGFDTIIEFNEPSDPENADLVPLLVERGQA